MCEYHHRTALNFFVLNGIKKVTLTVHVNEPFVAGSLESAYWLLRGGHSFLRIVFGSFMIIMWCHFRCTLWHHHFWNDVDVENDVASCCVWRNFNFSDINPLKNYLSFKPVFLRNPTWSGKPVPQGREISTLRPLSWHSPQICGQFLNSEHWRCRTTTRILCWATSSIDHDGTPRLHYLWCYTC